MFLNWVGRYVMSQGEPITRRKGWKTATTSGTAVDYEKLGYMATCANDNNSSTTVFSSDFESENADSSSILLSSCLKS